MSAQEPTYDIRPIEPGDMAWLRVLNDACVPAVNGLDDPALKRLVDRTAWTGVVTGAGQRWAVLTAFAKGSTYESTNYAWFNAQEEPFLYIDRVMVEAAGRGQGHGRRLYLALAAWAREAGLPRLCCEVNEVPPNPQSMAFHKAMGFLPLTSRINPADGKQVMMLERRLAPLP